MRRIRETERREDGGVRWSALLPKHVGALFARAASARHAPRVRGGGRDSGTRARTPRKQRNEARSGAGQQGDETGTTANEAGNWNAERRAPQSEAAPRPEVRSRARTTSRRQAVNRSRPIRNGRERSAGRKTSGRGGIRTLERLAT